MTVVRVDINDDDVIRARINIIHARTTTQYFDKLRETRDSDVRSPDMPILPDRSATYRPIPHGPTSVGHNSAFRPISSRPSSHGSNAENIERIEKF